ncbi:putative protocadherin alpha-3-like [Sesbania bispinosa]|nr:putative protocadherin alpha-3-like [Sesbania bispinosa]
MERQRRRERRRLTVEGGAQPQHCDRGEIARRGATENGGVRLQVERDVWPRSCDGDSATGGRARWRGQGTLKSNSERGTRMEFMAAGRRRDGCNSKCGKSCGNWWWPAAAWP